MKVAHDPGLALVPGLVLILPAINIATVVMKVDVGSTGAAHAHRILPDIVAGKHQGGQIKRGKCFVNFTVSLTWV